MRPSKLEHDDRISIDHKALSGRTFRVSDLGVANVGITETVTVTLVSGDTQFVLTGTVDDSAFSIECVNGDDEWTVFAQHIERA